MLGAWCWVVLGWFRLCLYFGLDCVIYGFSRLSPGCKVLHFKCKMAGNAGFTVVKRKFTKNLSGTARTPTKTSTVCFLDPCRGQGVTSERQREYYSILLNFTCQHGAHTLPLHSAQLFLIL